MLCQLVRSFENAGFYLNKYNHIKRGKTMTERSDISSIYCYYEAGIYLGDFKFSEKDIWFNKKAISLVETGFSLYNKDKHELALDFEAVRYLSDQIKNKKSEDKDNLIFENPLKLHNERVPAIAATKPKQTFRFNKYTNMDIGIFSGW